VIIDACQNSASQGFQPDRLVRSFHGDADGVCARVSAIPGFSCNRAISALGLSLCQNKNGKAGQSTRGAPGRSPGIIGSAGQRRPPGRLGICPSRTRRRGHEFLRDSGNLLTGSPSRRFGAPIQRCAKVSATARSFHIVAWQNPKILWPRQPSRSGVGASTGDSSAKRIDGP